MLSWLPAPNSIRHKATEAAPPLAAFRRRGHNAPWTVEEQACFVVRDHSGPQVG
jgi:hypothetical protein